MIPVMLFVGGPADGWMLSTTKQLYAVGLERPSEDGKALCAIYHVYGQAPGYAGDLPRHVETGILLYKADKLRAISLIDGWLPGIGNGADETVVDVKTRKETDEPTT
jgi:hypothetical protein